MEKWRLLSRQTVVSNKWIAVHRDECLTSRDVHVDGYYVVEKSDFAMGVALTPALELLLVRQYKHPTREIIVECPAGYIGHGEAPVAAMARELREETGYSSASIEPLGRWYGSPAVLTNHAYLFLCINATLDGPQQLDHSEDIELMVVDFESAMARLQSGDLVADLASTTALLLTRERLRQRGLLRDR